MKLVLDVHGLAEALSLSPITVRQYASRHPDRIPPRMPNPTRKLLWAVKDVEEWIDTNRKKPLQPEAEGA
jgi:hypothetical protein